MTMNEIWKDIVIEKNGMLYDYSGLYQVSNLGRVRSLNYKRTGEIKVLKSRKRKNGYLEIGLRKNGKKQERFSMHRLVATAFIPNSDVEHKTMVNHIDENPSNNVWTNLEWVTPKENTNHGTCIERRTKKNTNGKRSKKIICLETGKVYLSTNDVQRKLGLHQASISRCCNGKGKSCGGLHWKFYTDYLLDINNKNEQLLIA